MEVLWAVLWILPMKLQVLSSVSKEYEIQYFDKLQIPCVVLLNHITDYIHRIKALFFPSCLVEQDRIHKILTTFHIYVEVFVLSE